MSRAVDPYDGMTLYATVDLFANGTPLRAVLIQFLYRHSPYCMCRLRCNEKLHVTGKGGRRDPFLYHITPVGDKALRVGLACEMLTKPPLLNGSSRRGMRMKMAGEGTGR